MAYYTKARRVHFLDELRGLVVILMIIFHAAFDLVYVFGIRSELFFSPLFQSWLQPFIACNFIWIAGASSRYSRNNIKRGILVFGCAMLMTAATYFLMPDLTIRFGVLHLLGSCMIISGILEHFRRGRPDHLPALVGVIIFLALFIILRGVPGGRIEIPFTGYVFALPRFIYQPWAFPFGFPHYGFTSSDYFPLIPWFMLFSAGRSLGVMFHQNSMPEFFYRRHVPFLAKLGRHSLLIYLIHQPLTYGLLWAFFRLVDIIKAI